MSLVTQGAIGGKTPNANTEGRPCQDAASLTPNHKMTLEELMIFYTAQSNKEFDLVMAKEGELNVLDFAHQSFCLGCVMLLTERMMLSNLTNPDFNARLWAGKSLYELDQVRRKYREWN